MSGVEVRQPTKRLLPLPSSQPGICPTASCLHNSCLLCRAALPQLSARSWEAVSGKVSRNGDRLKVNMWPTPRQPRLSNTIVLGSSMEATLYLHRQYWVLTPPLSLLQCSLAVLQQHRRSLHSDTEILPAILELLMLNGSWK